jgi:hypothetical protein
MNFTAILKISGATDINSERLRALPGFRIATVWFYVKII